MPAVHPRERGEHRQAVYASDDNDRFIPASAGNTWDAGRDCTI